MLSKPFISLFGVPVTLASAMLSWVLNVINIESLTQFGAFTLILFQNIAAAIACLVGLLTAIHLFKKIKGDKGVIPILLLIVLLFMLFGCSRRVSTSVQNTEVARLDSSTYVERMIADTITLPGDSLQFTVSKIQLTEQQPNVIVQEVTGRHSRAQVTIDSSGAIRVRVWCDSLNQVVYNQRIEITKLKERGESNVVEKKTVQQVRFLPWYAKAALAYTGLSFLLKGVKFYLARINPTSSLLVLINKFLNKRS